MLIDAYGRQTRSHNYNYDTKSISRTNGGVGELVNQVDAVGAVGLDKNKKPLRDVYCDARILGRAVFESAPRPETDFLWNEPAGFKRRLCA